MIYLISIVIFFALLIFGLSFKMSYKKERYPSKYINGLEAMIEGKIDDAINIMKEVVEKDTTNRRAYLYLGNLLRKKGHISSAVKIHKNLSVIPELSRKEKDKVQKALAEDYLNSKEWKKAIPIYESLYKKDSKNKKLAQNLLMLHEKLKDWDKAYNMADKIYVNKKDLANYATFIASELVEKEKAKAMKFITLGQKAEIPYAHYLYGKLQIAEGNEKKGIEYLKKSISLDPKRAYIYLPLLEEYMFSRGEFGIIEPYLKNLVSESPGNWEILNSYVSILKKKGDMDKAKEILNDAVSNLELNRPDILSSIASAYYGVDKDEAFEYISKIQNLLNKTKKFKCSECGNEIKEFTWKCPNCDSPGTIY